MQSYQNNRISNQRIVNYQSNQVDPSIMQNSIQSNSNQNSNNTPSKCGFAESSSVFPVNYMYGQSYVPIQYIDSTFRPEVGLKMGTIFPELVSPYEPGQNMREIQFLASQNINQ